MKLCEIGASGLLDQTGDSVKSDSCWLYSYLYENIDSVAQNDIIAQTATHKTLASLVRAMREVDWNVKWPATKAVSNLLALDNEEIPN
jgi:hypothetical protein